MDGARPARLDDAHLALLIERSDRKGLVRLTLHAAVIATAGFGYAMLEDTVWMWPAAWAYGTCLVFLFAPLHESVHFTAFRSRWINRAVSMLCGFFVVLPPRFFRAFHLEHHRHTHDPERDPELGIPAPTTWAEYLWRMSGLQYWNYRIRTTLAHAAGRVAEPYIPANERPAVVREARGYLFTYVAIAAASLVFANDWALRLWLLPVLLGQPMLRLYLLAEHTGCPFVPDMLANSRSMKTTALVRFLAWNMPYHAEHHAHAAIPWHALPRAHRELAPGIRMGGSGYVAVHRELVATLR